jgi:hypothetical protein
MKTSQPIEAIGSLHPKTGSEIPVRIRAVPVQMQHGSVIGAVETFEELKPAANVRDRDDGPQHKRGDDEDDKPAASEQKPEPIKTPPAQEQPAAKEKRIGRKR